MARRRWVVSRPHGLLECWSQLQIWQAALQVHSVCKLHTLLGVLDPRGREAGFHSLVGNFWTTGGCTGKDSRAHSAYPGGAPLDNQVPAALRELHDPSSGHWLGGEVVVDGFAVDACGLGLAWPLPSTDPLLPSRGFTAAPLQREGEKCDDTTRPNETEDQRQPRSQCQASDRPRLATPGARQRASHWAAGRRETVALGGLLPRQGPRPR